MAPNKTPLTTIPSPTGSRTNCFFMNGKAPDMTPVSNPKSNPDNAAMVATIKTNFPTTIPPASACENTAPKSAAEILAKRKCSRVENQFLVGLSRYRAAGFVVSRASRLCGTIDARRAWPLWSRFRSGWARGSPGATSGTVRPGDWSLQGRPEPHSSLPQKNGDLISGRVIKIYSSFKTARTPFATWK